MSDTPRTDAAILPEGPGGTYQYECVSSELARTLERELAESKEHAQYEASRADGAVAELVAVHSENAALREKVASYEAMFRRGSIPAHIVMELHGDPAKSVPAGGGC